MNTTRELPTTDQEASCRSTQNIEFYKKVDHLNSDSPIAKSQFTLQGMIIFTIILSIFFALLNFIGVQQEHLLDLCLGSIILASANLIFIAISQKSDDVYR